MFESSAVQVQEFQSAQQFCCEVRSLEGGKTLKTFPKLAALVQASCSQRMQDIVDDTPQMSRYSLFVESALHLLRQPLQVRRSSLSLAPSTKQSNQISHILRLQISVGHSME